MAESDPQSPTDITPDQILAAADPEALVARYDDILEGFEDVRTLMVHLEEDVTFTSLPHLATNLQRLFIDLVHVERRLHTDREALQSTLTTADKGGTA